MTDPIFSNKEDIKIFSYTEEIKPPSHTEELEAQPLEFKLGRYYQTLLCARHQKDHRLAEEIASKLSFLLNLRPERATHPEHHQLIERALNRHD